MNISRETIIEAINIITRQNEVDKNQIDQADKYLRAVERD